MDSLYIVLPAYNEEANIEGVVKQWYPHLTGKHENSRLVIADSGSNDRTHDILVNMQKEYPQLEILSDTNRYHVPKLIALYDLAIKNNIDDITAKLLNIYDISETTLKHDVEEYILQLLSLGLIKEL